MRAGSSPNLGLIKSVLDRLPEATLSLDAQGRITYVSLDAASLLGKTRCELIGTPVSLYFPKSAIAIVVEASAPLDGGPSQTERNRVEFRAGGASRFVEVISRRVNRCDSADPPAEIDRILQLRDVTREHNESERRKQKIASLESYVHTVSHDLRSPLVALLGFTRLMKQDFGANLGESGRKFLDHIEQAGSHMNTLTQDLLELSIRRRSCTPPVAVDPRNVLLQIQAELKPRLEDKGIELQLPAAPAMIQCDRTQLYQVFSNLIGNAIQHMGPCEAPRISIEIERLPGQRVIVVRDNGRGIAASAHEQIFEAFHTLSRAGDPRSTGVGLSIVKKIALSYAGRVWVESEPGHGAAFFVSLQHRSHCALPSAGKHRMGTAQ